MGCALLCLAACGGSGSGADDRQGSSDPAPPSPPPPPANNAPSIGGTPQLSVVRGSPYAFTPTAGDPDGDALVFSVTGLPSWAVFDANDGTLSGTPVQSDVGVYADTTISVSDGQDTSSLAPFAITVTDPGIDSATLSWVAPTTDADGSPLNDLAGYVVYWGTSSGSYTQSAEIDNPGLTRFVLTGLAPGTYYFTIAAADLAGNQSAYSNEFSATVP